MEENETQERRVTTSTQQSRSLVADMAGQVGADAQAFWTMIRQEVFPDFNEQQILSALAIAYQYGLNPITKEIYLLKIRDRVAPYVSVDGFKKIANQHPQFDGSSTTIYNDQNGKPESATCKIYRKDRTHPTEVTVYFDECVQKSSPMWQSKPRHMLRGKAFREAAREAFGISLATPDDIQHDEPKTISSTSARKRAHEALGLADGGDE